MDEAQFLAALKAHGLTDSEADRLGKLPPGTLKQIILKILQGLLGSGLLGSTGSGVANARLSAGDVLHLLQTWLPVIEGIIKEIQAVTATA